MFRMRLIPQPLSSRNAKTSQSLNVNIYAPLSLEEISDLIKTEWITISLRDWKYHCEFRTEISFERMILNT